MGPVNWLAAALSTLVMLGLWALWQSRTSRATLPALLTALALFALPAMMIAHALARIGADKLAVKPWLYWMQTGGIAAFFVIPALWLARASSGWRWREALAEAGFWLAAFLAMGTVFWVLG
jgi:hypothetical protein